MVDKFYLNIIVNAESSIYKEGSRDKLLSGYYLDAFTGLEHIITKQDFFSNLLKVFDVFEEDLQEQRHEHTVLMDVVPELVINKIIEIDLNKYQPDKKFWKFDYPLEEYRVKQHKKSIELAFKAKLKEKFSKQGNPYPRIFKSLKAFNLFENILSTYQNKENLTANFSFVYYAMKNDKYIICGGTEFKKFLSIEYEIVIDRIDNRQSNYNSNKRTEFYNSIKRI